MCNRSRKINFQLSRILDALKPFGYFRSPKWGVGASIYAVPGSTFSIDTKLPKGKLNFRW